MLTTQSKHPPTRRLASPQMPKSPRSPELPSTETEYQLRVRRQSKKICPILVKGVQKDSTETEERSVIGRKLSLRQRAGETGKSLNRDRTQIGMKIQQQPTQRKTAVSRQQLALQIEYNQFGSQRVRPSRNCQQQPHNSSTLQRRIRRIRSSDSNSSQTSSLALQLDVKVKAAKEDNERLKQVKSQTLIRLEELQSVYSHEKKGFLGEIVNYQRQIEALKRRIERNRNELGHIFTYQAFDLAKLVVNPIVEMDGEYSQVRSVVTPEFQFQELQHQSRLRKGTLKESDGKEHLTETTGPVSRQDYGELDYF